MLAVHGQDTHAVFLGFAHHDFAGHDQDFFGGDGDVFARAYVRWRRIRGYAEAWVVRVAGNLAIDAWRRRIVASLISPSGPE